MLGIMDSTAEGRMERCVQPATHTCKHTHTYALLHILWQRILIMLKSKAWIIHGQVTVVQLPHTLWHTGEVLGLVSHVTLSRHEWAYSLGMLRDSRGAKFSGCVQDELRGNSCVCLCSCEPTHGAPVCERNSVSANERASDTGMCHSSCKPLSS